MIDIYGLPQTLTGNETVTIHQVQNGQPALCTMSLTTLFNYFQSLSGGAGINWSALPTTLPTTPGLPWNNNGAVCIS
jgi:hypothetical protein